MAIGGGYGVVVRDASVVTSRPIVPPPMSEYTQPEALTTGSQLNEAAVGGPAKAIDLTSGSTINEAQEGSPWPKIIDGAIKFFTGWRANSFREISNHNVIGNYGAKTSVANYGFRSREFEANSYAGYPNAAIPTDPRAPTWNNLVPVIWGLRVLNPVSGGSFDQTTQAAKVVSQFTESTSFTPAGTASLSLKGEVLQ